jgi:hypothetical protein
MDPHGEVILSCVALCILVMRAGLESVSEPVLDNF